MTPLQFKQALRHGPYAWPGGYPLFFLCDDGEALCHTCARAEFRNICMSILRKQNDGWRIVAQDVNWEDNEMFCAHCNEQIKPAYGED